MQPKGGGGVNKASGTHITNVNNVLLMSEFWIILLLLICYSSPVLSTTKRS